MALKALLRSLCVIALLALATAHADLRGRKMLFAGAARPSRELHDFRAPRIATMELSLKRSGAVLARPCRGVDSVTLILELRIAQMSGCSTTDVATTAVQCSAWGINTTISFVTVAGRSLGVNAAALGTAALRSVLDPLGTQFNLTLVTMHAHGHGLQSSGWDVPGDAPTV